MNPLRALVESRVDRLVGPTPSDVPFDLSTGDAGLYGHGAVAWEVHGDFATMMVGGIAALLLQMLHPVAMAGVWDHSDFRRDMTGRLRRTARFVGATTYASTDQAQAMIDRIRRIHAAVAGTLPDGTPYSAEDPDALAWVHVAGEWCFLEAWRRYREPAMSRARQDRFFAETAELARRLGAAEVPQTRAAADAYLAAMRPKLRADDRTAAVVSALEHAADATPAMRPLQALAMAAAADLLPPWAARMHGLAIGPARRPLVRAGTLGLTSTLRWALKDRTRRKDALLRGRRG